MTTKKSRLDSFLKAADKISESKGVSKLANAFDKTLNIAGNAVEAAADVANHQLDERNKRHLDDVKVPDIDGLTLVQTKELFDSLDIKYALVAETPNVTLATRKADTVIRTLPKANAVLSAGSFVKIYYLDAEVIAASKNILLKNEERKQTRKESAKAIAGKIGHGTVAGASGVVKATAGLTGKLKLKSKKPMQITATIIDTPIEAKDVTPEEIEQSED